MHSIYGGVILAGGKGLRLMPLTAKTPKPLLNVNGQTPLLRCVNALKEAGIKNVAVTTGYLSEEIEKFEHNDMDISFFKEVTPKGTAGAVLEMLNLMDEDFFVLSGDVIFDISLRDMMEYHKSKNADLTLATVRSSSPTEYGTVISKNGFVTSFLEKPSWKQLISTKINTGIYIIKKKAIERADKEIKDFASELFPWLISERKSVCCYESEGYWCDIGTPESYLSCNMNLSKGENVLGDFISISTQSQISNSVLMNGIKIEKGTKITSSIISEGVSVGKNCIIDGAVIGADTLICDGVIIEKGAVIEPDTIINKGELIKKSKHPSYVFSDSGTISFSDNETEMTEFLANALISLTKNDSHKGKICLFHDITDEAKTIASNLSAIILKNGESCTSPVLGCSPIASFSAKTSSDFSVYIKSDKNSTTCCIFDRKGFPLSRQDQIKVQKSQKSYTKSFPANEINTNFTELYIKEKTETIKKLLPIKSGVNISIKSENFPSSIAREILSRCNVSLNTEKEFYSMHISEDGEDVYCLTPTGEKLDKMHLFRLCCAFLPQAIVGLPEFSPSELKDTIRLSGGVFFVYSDENKSRKADTGLYSFSDGISISLGVICSCITSTKDISDLEQTLPPFYFIEKSIDFHGDRGVAFDHLLSSYCANSEEGIISETDAGSVRILPQYISGFKIFASSSSAETANELITPFEKEFERLDHQENQA